MPSKQNIEKIGEWKAKKVDRIVIEPRKERRLPERVAEAVRRGRAASRQDYIISAVEDALKRDGLPPEAANGDGDKQE